MSIICTCGKASGPMCNGAVGCPLNGMDGVPAPKRKTWKERLAEEQAKQASEKPIDDIKTIHSALREWCYAKRKEKEQANNHMPLFTCMDEAIISVLADMELRLRKLENKLNEQ
jgi:hypothetical protein